MPKAASISLLILRILLGLFFIYSGSEKLLRLDDFTQDVFNYQILFPPYDAYAAYLLPWVELLAGLAVLIGRWGKNGGLMLIAGMMLVFIAALAHAWSQGLNINCGCFSKSEEPTNFPLAIGRNLLITAIAAVFFFFPNRKGAKPQS